MRRTLAAGAVYFAIAFAAGFALGALRVTLVVPAIGEIAATLVELPVILIASWLACLFVVRRFEVAAAVHARLIMGAVAFALLMAAELALGTGLMNRSLQEQLAEMTSGAGLLGVAAQILFALFPLIALLRRR